MTITANIRLGHKGLPRTNTLAYLPGASMTKKKLMTLTPIFNINFLFFVVNKVTE
jgi:hypothetical protein